MLSISNLNSRWAEALTVGMSFALTAAGWLWLCAVNKSGSAVSSVCFFSSVFDCPYFLPAALFFSFFSRSRSSIALTDSLKAATRGVKARLQFDMQ